MMKQALGTAAAAVFATAIAGAQEPAQSQQTQQASQQQMVTVEGCLHQDRGISAQASDESRDADTKFMLVSAEVQSGAGAMASRSSSESATDTAAAATTGTAGQQERAVGTSGSAADATRFKVVGLDDDRLSQYAGQRVRIQGHFDHDAHGAARAEPSSDMPKADSAAADRPAADSNVTAGTAGATGTSGTTAAPESSSASAMSHGQHASMAGDVRELRAASIEPVEGSCPVAPENR